MSVRTKLTLQLLFMLTTKPSAKARDYHSRLHRSQRKVCPALMEPTSRILIQSLKPRNLLSFGPAFPGVELTAMNLLIGPNGSGKSNLLEAIQVLRAAPRGIDCVFRSGGGYAEWPWKGASRGKNESGDPSIECRINVGMTSLLSERDTVFQHSMSFSWLLPDMSPVYETIFDNSSATDATTKIYSNRFLFGGSAMAVGDNGERIEIEMKDYDIRGSVLAALKDPKRFPEITEIANKYLQIRIYREWTFGRNAIFRTPQRADMRNDVLEEDFSNLGLVLNRLKTRFPAAKKAILNGLKDLYDGINDFDVLIEGGSVQVFFTEGDFVIPATRLSDGTLRYLCLLAILCDPTPPPLICIEEPELGLHPDVLPNLAELLIAASERTQLIVTTHSDILVDAMTERPEAVVICEKHNGCTEMKRLSQSDLAVWLQKYRLGQLWIDGQLGGKRW